MDQLPQWARPLLDDNGCAQIERALAEAESRTSGEIVPLVVRRSSAVGHVPYLVFFMLFSAALLLNLPGWQSGWFGPHALWVIVDGFLAGVAAVYLGRKNTVQRYLTTPADQAWQVDARAEVEFYELGLNQTRGRTGILLMVSLMEHRAVVLADKSISEKLDASTWERAVDLMLSDAKHGDLSTGICQAITACGDVLAEHFPVDPDDENELRDHLIVKDYL